MCAGQMRRYLKSAMRRNDRDLDDNRHLVLIDCIWRVVVLKYTSNACRKPIPSP